jgi:hypothetical protein
VFWDLRWQSRTILAREHSAAIREAFEICCHPHGNPVKKVIVYGIGLPDKKTVRALNSAICPGCG